jgi:hypothetical protein
MKYYLAYGSNLNKTQMSLRCPDAKPFGRVLIEDHELTFRGNSSGWGVANIEPKAGCTVQAGLWYISQKDEASLDMYEGYPHLYTKKELDVICDGQVVRAMVYVMKRNLRFSKPSEGYLKTIEDGYADFGFDTAPLLDAVVGSSIKQVL